MYVLNGMNSKQGGKIMKKLLFVLLILITGSACFAVTPTVTQTVTQTVTPTMKGGKALPTATITVTPFLSPDELILWKEKFEPIKRLNDIKPFLYINRKDNMNDSEIENYVKENIPVNEILIVKTAAMIKVLPTKTPTKTIIGVKTK